MPRPANADAAQYLGRKIRVQQDSITFEFIPARLDPDGVRVWVHWRNAPDSRLHTPEWRSATTVTWSRTEVLEVME